MHARDPMEFLNKYSSYFCKRVANLFKLILNIEQTKVDEITIKSENEVYKFEKSVITSELTLKNLLTNLVREFL